MQPIEKTLYNYLTEYAEDEPNKPFYEDEEKSYTVYQTLCEVQALANQINANGVNAGDVVALRATRSIEAGLLFYALQAIGVLTMLVDAHGKVGDFVKDSGVDIKPKAIITNEEFSCDIAAREGWTLNDCNSGNSTPIQFAQPQSQSKLIFREHTDVYQPAVIIFTSGSTGKSKGVVLTHYNYINHLRNAEWGRYLEDDVSVNNLPFHHVFGWTLVMMALIRRHFVFFPKTVEFDYVAQCIERYKATRLDGVPSFALALATYVKNNNVRIDSLRVAVMGGAPCTIDQACFIEQTLNLKIIPVYGMSELVAISYGQYENTLEQRCGSVGKFLPMNKGYIVNEEGVELPHGKEGEICVTGPALFYGYYNDEKATKEAVDEYGRLHTGDLGYIDEEGFLHITGRIKDIIIRHGHNLSAAKIEKGILALEYVYAAAVVGIKDEIGGEAPAALIVFQSGEVRSREQILEDLRKRLNKNELPVKIKIVDAIPLTATGKTDKVKIKEMF